MGSVAQAWMNTYTLTDSAIHVKIREILNWVTPGSDCRIKSFTQKQIFKLQDWSHFCVWVVILVILWNLHRILLSWRPWGEWFFFFPLFYDLILNSFKFDSNQMLKLRSDNKHGIAYIYHDMRKPVHANLLCNFHHLRKTICLCMYDY